MADTKELGITRFIDAPPEKCETRSSSRGSRPGRMNPVWSLLDTTPEGRGAECFPKVGYG